MADSTARSPVVAVSNWARRRSITAHGDATRGPDDDQGVLKEPRTMPDRPSNVPSLGFGHHDELVADPLNLVRLGVRIIRTHALVRDQEHERPTPRDQRNIAAEDPREA